MIDYVYRAKSLDTGAISTGMVKAETPQAAAKVLKGQNLFALDITIRSKSTLMGKLGLNTRVSAKERVLFTRQLSTLVNAGLPLARALRTVQDQVKSQALREVVAAIVASVEGGSSLGDAFAQHPKVFNEIYVALVAAGETSGSLDKTLLRLANQQEKEASIASKIRGAMIYPAIVLVLIIGVVGLMVTTVVPQVAQLYSDLHKPLPLPTQLLMYLSSYLTHFWWLNIIIIAIIVYVLRRFLATENAKLQMDRLKLQLPIMKTILMKVYMARFARTMHTLLASGIPMLQALDTVKRSVGNRLVAKDLENVTVKVRGGQALSDALEPQAHFLPLVHQMSKIGEESGAIDEMFNKVATYYEEEVDEAIRNLSTTLEPVMMVILGGIVAAVLAAVLGPVYSLVGGGATSDLK